MTNRFALSLALLAATLAACSRTEQVELKVHHLLPPRATAHAKFIVPWCEKIELESAGDLKCRIYPAMQLGGSPAQLYDQARDGVVDIIWTVPGYSAGRFPSIEVFELPFMMRNAEVTSKALWDYVAQNNLGEFDDVHLLAFHVHGPGYFHMVEQPITSQADLKGMKIRAGGGTHSQIIAALGATQVSMPGADAYTAMQRGTLDAIHFNDAAALTFKLHEVSKFRSSNGFNVLTVEYCMGSDWFDALPADLQVVVNNWGRQMAIAEAVGFYDYGGQVNVIKMQEQGLQKVDLPESELNRWREAVAGVEAAWVDDAAKKGLPAKEFIADIKELAKKYADMSANDIMLDAINNPVQGMYDMKSK